MGANGKECSGRGKLEEDDNMGDFLEVKEDISSNSRLQGFTSSSSMPSSMPCAWLPGGAGAAAGTASAAMTPAMSALMPPLSKAYQSATPKPP